MMFPKPEKKTKQDKPYNSLQQRGLKKSKVIAPWRQNILSSHHSNPSRADRAEFPLSVVSELMKRADGLCECCKQNQDTETHHIRPRARDGRGVLQNGLRLCRVCHVDIQTHEEKLKYWENEWVNRYGPNFWFDDQDKEDYSRKQTALLSVKNKRIERLNQIQPIISLLSSAPGRELDDKEIKLLEKMGNPEILVFQKMMNDIVKEKLATIVSVI